MVAPKPHLSAVEGEGGRVCSERVPQHVVEFVSDSGEGAQSAGFLFARLAAKAGYGVWTVEIIPAEIEPPHRSRSGASGNRIRFAPGTVTNMGDEADIVVAFNEQVLYSRIDVGALKAGTIVLLESKWANDPDDRVRTQYAEALEDFRQRRYVVIEVPMEKEVLQVVSNPRRGKNVWALGMVTAIYGLPLDAAEQLLRERFGRKGEEVIAKNLELLQRGRQWGEEHLHFRFDVPVEPDPEADRVAMNGNQAIALGICAAGMEVCAMYPITPATSASHYLARIFPKTGGVVHQSEDEIAAIGFAIGASYAGKTAVTITSGPGFALKTEMIGLAAMAEIPLVIVVVQRGGPSTGLPTRVEQSDLLAAMFSTHGDAPKVVMAPSTISECFHFVITARQIAEAFRTPVVILSDANLATGQQTFERPIARAEWFAPPIDQSDWDPSVAPYAWDPETGLSRRPIPGQRGGQYRLTGLAHDEWSQVAYEAAINQRAQERRFRKFRTLQATLRPPTVYGDDEGDLLVIGWGSTRGAIEEAVDRVRATGARVSALHLRFLYPLEPGLREIMARFKRVMTVEINYSDPPDWNGLSDQRRYAQLAMWLRANTLVDVDCWSKVPGIPLSPGAIERELRRRLSAG